MEIKLIIFDCDGTLIDSEYINNKATSDVLIELGHKEFTIDYCIRFFAGCSMHDVLDTLKKLRIPNPEITLDAMQTRAIAMAKNNLAPISNAIETVKKITLPKAVASNGERKMVITSLSITGLSKYFDNNSIFTCELVKKAKPAPDIYLYAAEKMGGIEPKHCLVIEDSVRGIIAGKAAGMNVLGFTGGNHHNDESKQALKDAGAMQIIENLAEILHYL